MKTFIEIGSCDFNTLNYLGDLNWKGVIIEPIKKYLDNIPQKPNIHYLNYAIDWSRGQRVMFIAPDDIVEQDRDYAGMSSFYQYNNTLSKEILVNTIPILDVIKMCDITEIDFLKIDTELWDYEILKMFPFDRVSPRFIKVETRHQLKDEVSDFLKSKGYHIETDTGDLFAIKI
jgi:FkbM family methyltransferase